jgi:cytochrome c
MGPPLKGMVGRKAGTVAGFAYSPALKASGITWNADSLDKYIAKPTAVVPGTKMMVGTADATKRAAIVAYLVAQK